MSMNEKTFQQVLSLHSKGLGEEASLLGILQLIYGQSDHREAVKWIKKFYEETSYQSALLKHKWEVQHNGTEFVWRSPDGLSGSEFRSPAFFILPKEVIALAKKRGDI